MELKIIALTLVVSSLVGCYHTGSKDKSSSQDIELSRLKPQPGDQEELFVRGDDGDYYNVSVGQLRSIYKESYISDYHTFDDFKVDVLASRTLIHFNDSVPYSTQFSINEKMMAECQKLGVEAILNRYFEKQGKQYKLKPAIVSDKMTIIYYLWLNGYEYSRDCYFGEDWVRKVKTSSVVEVNSDEH